MSTPAPYLDPLNQAFADQLANQPPLQDLSVEQVRKLLDDLQKHTPNPNVTRTSFTVPFENGVKTYVFRPKGAKGILPVIFFFHGGGWTSGNTCRDLALQTGCAVVFPEYTLAPEARYPTQQEECYAVVKWVHKHGESKLLSQSVFSIVGDSAGGQLTGAVSILCSTRKPYIPIRYQVMISPVTDTITSDRDTKSEFDFFNGPFLTVPFMRKSVEDYIPNADDRVNELATLRNISVAHAKKQPPTLIINSAADPLRDDGILYGEILQRAGVDCTIITGHGQLHDSLIFEALRGSATPKAMVRLMATQIKNASENVGVEVTEIETEEEPSRKRRRRH
ncbi:alpha/beta hydrolase fold-3 domain containing protein [Pyrenophora tritici-repentis Pt-1C-BFP]|uniref:Alpha/beta hydrolase fold-3 domain containing protein n=1 Tax=Pyrenophora tritici-repentis (strain Pt-1C-BFP) TaxID=426418 RepID=B2WHZ9_PYRTR|nr:alpha/beta hydrolase fold-3 domain containing protein [Pyrenophora tritici-repentis Pt-1C-BFP]EDU42659.1 alpha/beta hydrolase fold-3 domain containing protein [Pyrenophora tritici-repentis Pt-1C-BFP]